VQLRRIDARTGPRSSDQVPAATIPVTPPASGPAKARAYTLAHPISASASFSECSGVAPASLHFYERIGPILSERTRETLLVPKRAMSSKIPSGFGAVPGPRCADTAVDEGLLVACAVIGPEGKHCRTRI
jgi:hypothetical protein